MGTAFLYGNGGGGIKFPFRIFYGTTQPSNPKNNDIWIKTSVAITMVDFVNTSWSGAAVGRTIIIGTTATGTPSASNTLTFVVDGKSNGILTYGRLNLTKCMQVQGSAGNWVSLNAYRYYGGTWVQFSTTWNGELFEQGNVHADVTGGWNKSEGSSGTEVAITNSTTGNTISPSNGGTMYMYTVNKVDVTNWNTMTFVVSAKNSSDGFRLGISTSQKRPTADNGFDKVVYAGSAGTYNLDISAITGSVYVTMYLWGSFAINSIYMTK